MKKIISLLFFAAAVLVAQAQSDNDFYELLKQDLKMQKDALVSEAMQLTNEESEKFWPIYKAYSAEMSVLFDRRMKNLENYANNYDSMDDAKAKEVTTEYFSEQSKRVKVLTKYTKQMEKAIGARKAGLFYQIENQMKLLMDFQIASEIPLIK